MTEMKDCEVALPMPSVKQECIDEDDNALPAAACSSSTTNVTNCIGHDSDEKGGGSFVVEGATPTENKQIYRSLKRKIKSLLYEQECFYEELRRLQRKLLRINRDKSFLLDRLLQYEIPEFSSSDEEETASSSGDDLDKSYFKSDAPIAPVVKHPKKAVTAPGKNSTSKGEQTNRAPSKPKRSIENVERVRCKQMENGKRCPKMVSKRVKSGLCLIHRQPVEAEKKPSCSTPQECRVSGLPRSTPAKQSHLGPSTVSPMISGGFIHDDLQVSDDRDMQQDMFDITDNITNSGPADSPASPDFHSNIYDGDDDLVIDLPE